jgi:arylsulfatase A-like enzyme/Tfp pilus assembly protein PilF
VSRRGAWLLALALLSGGCGRGERWNVLLVTFDTTRADRIGCYGNAEIETPVIDGLAAEGVRFARASSAVPITAPSHSTILTGRYPLAHGVRDNGLFQLGDGQLTLAEMLADRGYATAAAIGAYPLIGQFGFGQGFDLFDDHVTGGFEDYLGDRGVKQRFFFDERRAAQVNEAVLPWLAEHAREPFFLWVHYFDPHQPFEPAPPFDQLYAHDPYDGEIAYADSRLGFLLDRLRDLGVMERTLVVMTADHGEGLSEHDEVTHAVLAYESTLHVPLIVRPPAGLAPAGRVVEERVGTVDIVPTVLELLGLEAPEGLQGRSLVPTWRGPAGSRSAQRPYYAENLSPRLSHGWGELRVLYDPPLKYIHGPRPELFDLEDDPRELRDLSGERPAEARRLRDALSRFMADHARGVSAIQAVDEEVRERLAALGYLHAGAAAGQEIAEVLRDDGAAPRDRVGDVNDLSAAKHLLFEGRGIEALGYTRRLTRRDPDSPVYLELHATALLETGRLADASEALERLAGTGQVPERLVLRLAARRFEAGDQRRASDELARHLARAPSAPAAWLLASFQERLGEPDEARRSIEQALRLRPEFSPARVDLAVQHARAGDADAAEREFLRALQDGPYYPKAHYNYGTFLLHAGRLEAADAAFRRAVALAPSYLKARLALVAVTVAAGDAAAAGEAQRALQHLAPASEEAASAAALLREL